MGCVAHRAILTLGRIVESRGVGDDDPVAGGEAAQNLDLGDRGGAELDRHAPRLVAAQDIDVPGLRPEERAALEL